MGCSKEVVDVNWPEKQCVSVWVTKVGNFRSQVARVKVGSASAQVALQAETSRGKAPGIRNEQQMNIYWASPDEIAYGKACMHLVQRAMRKRFVT